MARLSFGPEVSWAIAAVLHGLFMALAPPPVNIPLAQLAAGLAAGLLYGGSPAVAALLAALAGLASNVGLAIAVGGGWKALMIAWSAAGPLALLVPLLVNTVSPALIAWGAARLRRF